jgi:chromosomal replication initiator protein
MNKTAQSVWKTACLLLKTIFRTSKTWFEPIKSVELTDNALYIQVPSKFFYEWLEALCKTIKVALTKNLVKMQSYFIKSKWKTLMVINNRLRNNYKR